VISVLIKDPTPLAVLIHAFERKVPVAANVEEESPWHWRSASQGFI
jgi:hypothetical protein